MGVAAGWFPKLLASLRARGPRVLRSIVYYVPLYFLGEHLGVLSGAALWLPPESRQTVRIVALGMGFACFHIARIWNESDRVASESLTAKSTRGAAKRERESLRARLASTSRANRRGVLLWVLAAVLFLGHTRLRQSTMLEEDFGLQDVYDIYRADGPRRNFHAEWPTLTLDERSELVQQWRSQVRKPLYVRQEPTVLAHGDDPPTISLLVFFPLSFPVSDAAKEMVASWQALPEYVHEMGPRAFGLQYDLGRVLASLAPNGCEADALGLTETLFFLLHFAVIAAVSLALGATFTLAEELLLG